MKKQLDQRILTLWTNTLTKLGIGPEGALLMARVGIRVYNLILKAMGL